MTKESTISSGHVARQTASWKVLVSAASTTCLFGMLFVGSHCFAQPATVEHAKVAVVTKNGKSVVAESQTAVKVSKTQPNFDTKLLPTAKATADSKSPSSVKSTTGADLRSGASVSSKPALDAKAAPATKAAIDPKVDAKSKAGETSLSADGKKTDGAKAGAVDKNAKDKHAPSPSVHSKAKPAAMLVPPPPPDTPTMIPNFGSGDESNGLMPMEYMSPELLKKRKDDLVLQLADAKSEAKKRADEAQSIKEKGVQFKTLFDEGVISKRELDAAEKDASDVDASINRAKLRVSELQTLLDGVSGRINQIDNRKSSKSVTIKVVSTKQKKKHSARDSVKGTPASAKTNAPASTARRAPTNAAASTGANAATSTAASAATSTAASAATNAATSTPANVPGAQGTQGTTNAPNSSSKPTSYSNPDDKKQSSH